MIAITSSLSSQPDSSLIDIYQRVFCPSPAQPQPLEKRRADRAFAELLSRYDRWLWKQVKGFSTLNADDAYSAALEGFQKAIANFDLRSGHALATWAFTCVRSAIIAVFRQEGSQSKKVTRIAAVTPLVHEDECPDPYEQEQLHNDLAHLNQAIAKISDSKRQIIEMRNAGYKYAEIGDRLGKSADAIRMAHRRAIAALKGMVNPASPQEEPRPTPEDAEQNQSQPHWMQQLWQRKNLCVRFFHSLRIWKEHHPIGQPHAYPQKSSDTPPRPFFRFAAGDDPQLGSGCWDCSLPSAVRRMVDLIGLWGQWYLVCPITTLLEADTPALSPEAVVRLWDGGGLDTADQSRASPCAFLRHLGERAKDVVQSVWRC
ncbi:MAG: sigma-70 family RNA polymerase sigma factor [Aphanocapsa sp. GSE-SYN-MK-11-07L]|jgi:RNA polymerase sigma-70 factor (ECF subfamily)|nr:sigma-70 family RNA polymerase sigma factor [Aphanocapsa sp. GSE-SYN-MK-11-07L]